MFPSEPHFDFSIEESREADGAVRLLLLGELDLWVASVLQDRLSDLDAREERVRIDLSRVGFIDCAGLSPVIEALSLSRANGRRIALVPELSPAAERLIGVLALAPWLWPAGEGG